MARQLSKPGNDRGRGIITVLGHLGESFTRFAEKCGVSFSVWHRVVHASGDPNTETTIIAKLVRGGMPLHLIAPTLHKELLRAGWHEPEASKTRSVQGRVA